MTRRLILIAALLLSGCSCLFHPDVVIESVAITPDRRPR